MRLSHPNFRRTRTEACLSEELRRLLTSSVSILAWVSILCCMGILPAFTESSGGAASEKELLAKFQDAFSKKDAANFQRLIYKPGLSKKAEASMVYVFKADSSGGTAQNHRLLGKDCYDKAMTERGRKPKNGPIVKNGISYDYPIPLYGYLMFDLKSKNGSVTASYPVGKSDDKRLFFVARIMVKQKSAD